MPAKIDMVGKRFGRWIVVSENGCRVNGIFWNCLCDCGNSGIVSGMVLRDGRSKSCGCLMKEQAKARMTTHGHSFTRTYSIWSGMVNRCANPSQPSYKEYGGRGIKVCKKWRRFSGFLADMGDAPEGKTLDRIDNDKGYSKKNCRWSTGHEQAMNRRVRKIQWRGETHTIGQWALILGVDRSNLHHRLLRGWTIEEAFTLPYIRGKKSNS